MAKIKVEVESNSLEETRKRIEAIKSEMLDTKDVDTFNKLALEAGDLETQIARTEDAVRELSNSGSELTKISTGLGSVGSSLASLDFESAAESAGRIANISKQMTFGSAIKSLKSLGSTFVNLGKTLLSNPLFLIAGVIAGLVAAIVALMDELGLLEVIMDGIGKVFEWIMIPINALIDGLKALTDWFGWTDNAGEDYAEAQLERNEKLLESNKKVSESTVDSLQQEIDMRKIAGEDTTQLEREKLQEIRANATEELNIARENAKHLAKLHGKDSDEYKEQIEAIEGLKIARRESAQEVKLFEAQVAQDRIDGAKKEAEELKKIEEDKAKELEAKREEWAKQARERQERTTDFIIDLQRKRRDNEIDMIEDEIERNKEAQLTKLERQQEDIDFSEMSAEAKIEWDKWYADEVDRIENEAVEKTEEREKQKKKLKIQSQEEAQKVLKEMMLEFEGNQFLTQKENILDAADERLELLKTQLENELITLEQFNAAKIALEKNTEEQLNALKGGEEGMSATEAAQLEAEQMLEIEKQRLEAGIITKQEYAEREAQIEKNLGDKIKQINKDVRDAKIASFQSQLGEAQGAFNAITNLAQVSNEAQIAAAEGNEERQEQLRKQGFERNKKLQIAAATMAGIQGVINALTAQSTIPEPFGTVLKAINAGVVAATTAANIKKIKSTSYQGGGGGGAAGVSGAGASAGGAGQATRALPSVNFENPGQGDTTDANNVSAGGNSININNQVTVSESEVTGTQQTVQNLTQSAQL